MKIRSGSAVLLSGKRFARIITFGADGSVTLQRIDRTHGDVQVIPWMCGVLDGVRYPERGTFSAWACFEDYFFSRADFLRLLR